MKLFISFQNQLRSQLVQSILKHTVQDRTIVWRMLKQNQVKQRKYNDFSCHQVSFCRVTKHFLNLQCFYVSEYTLYFPTRLHFFLKQSTMSITIRGRFFVYQLISLTPQKRGMCKQHLNLPMQRQITSFKDSGCLALDMATPAEKLLKPYSAGIRQLSTMKLQLI